MQRVMYLLNKITTEPQDTTLSKFADALYKRYEEEEIPLSKVMNADLGLGFDQSIGHGDISTISDDILLTHNTNTSDIITEKTRAVDRIAIEKLKKARKNNESMIDLKESDFKQQIENWTDLPNTYRQWYN